MTLTDSQVEQQLTQRRLDIESLQLALKQLQGRIDALTKSLPSDTGSTSTNGIDEYLIGGAVWHYLKHIFKGLVNLVSLTASRPLKLDASNNIISGKIDLSQPSTDVQNTLGVPNGGTGQATLSANQVLMGNGTSGIASQAGVNGPIALSPSLQILNYVDTVNGPTTVAVFIGIAITANNFTNGVRST